jgi:hypothetical protein
MANTPSCSTLLAQLTANTCLGEKKPGGVDGLIYVGHRFELASATFGTNGEVTAFTLASGKKLYKFAGKKEEHEPKWALVEQKPRNMFRQTIDLFFYPYTQSEIEAIQQLCLAERMFAIVITSAGQCKIYGIDRNPWVSGNLDDERGMKPIAAEAAEGKTISADTFNKVTLEGLFYEVPKLYGPANSLSTNLTALDAMV